MMKRDDHTNKMKMETEIMRYGDRDDSNDGDNSNNNRDGDNQIK